jgi:hypothetical protein
MEVTKEDIEQFSKKVNGGPPLWNAIRTDGNCFFQALEYAVYQKLSKTPKIIKFRQTIVRTMNKPIVSGVPYKTFMYGTKSDGTKSDDTKSDGTKWPYAELDVVIAAAKYIKRTILVISLGKNGGVTMISPKDTIGNPVFLICDQAKHYIPFQKGIKLTKMKQKLKGFEKKVEHTDGAVITSFLLKDMESVMKPIKNIKSVRHLPLKPVNSLILTRKKLNNSTFVVAYTI